MTARAGRPHRAERATRQLVVAGGATMLCGAVCLVAGGGPVGTGSAVLGLVLLSLIGYRLVVGLLWDRAVLGSGADPSTSPTVVVGLAVDIAGRDLDARTLRGALAQGLGNQEAVEVSVRARRGQLEFLLYGEDAQRLRERATAVMTRLELPAAAFRIEQLHTPG